MGRMRVVLFLLAEVWVVGVLGAPLLEPPRPDHHLQQIQQTRAKVGDWQGIGDDPAAAAAAAGGSSFLKDTVLRLDQLLQRPNDYNIPMYESGEEDDQFSRLLYEAQEEYGNSDLTGVTLLRSPRTVKAYEENVKEEETSRRKRMAMRRRSRERGRSKEKRCKPKGGRSRERRPRPRSRERRPRPRSRERRPGSRERCEEEMMSTTSSSTTTTTTSTTTTPATTTTSTTTPTTTTSTTTPSTTTTTTTTTPAPTP